MKKILLGILLPILTFVTLIGTGYATWYFDAQTTANQSNNISQVDVIGYAQIGTLQITQSATSITLDQPKTTTTDGVSLDKAIKGTYTQPTLEDHQIKLGGKITVTITIPQALSKYVTLDTTKKFNEFATNFTNSNDNPESENIFTATLDFNDTINVYNLELARDILIYREASIPKDINSYKTMLAAVASQTITVSFTASLNK